MSDPYSTPPQLPVPPQAPVKEPFARQAAKFSAWAPALFILSTVISPSLSKEPAMKLVFSCFALLLLFAGFVLGIVALFGIRKHGRKGILVPAIIGTTLNFLFLILAIIGALFVINRQHQRDVQREMLRQRIEAEQNRETPSY